jgi:hypothetical protein
MISTHLFMSAALVGLCACSLIAKGKTKVAGDSSGAPTVTADANDPPRVKNALAKLEEIEKLLATKKWSDYARESARFHSYFMFEQGLEGERKRGAIIKRLDALDASAFKAFSRLHALVGAGTRVVDVEKDALEPIVAVLDECDGSKDIRSKGALDEKLARYEKALERVKKVDANAFRYYGETNSRFGTEDVATTLLACEANLASAASGFADEYVAETVPATEVEVGCGMAVVLADGIRVGPNQFAPYTRTEGGASYPEKLDCNKLKKKSNHGSAFAAAVADYAKYIEIPQGDLIVVTDGKPYVEESQSDSRLHRFQKLVAYSKKFRFAKNPCGGKNTFCEAGGSKGAEAFNRLEHALDRAQVHAGSNPALCKAHLKDAKARADWFAEFHADSKKRGSWVGGATYKTKKGQKLKEADFISTFSEKGELADERFLGKYCESPRKEKKGV